MQLEDNPGLAPHVVGGLPSSSPLADITIYLDQVGYPPNHGQKPARLLAKVKSSWKPGTEQKGLTFVNQIQETT